MEKYGIRKGYPLLRKYFGRFTAYIQLCRPFTLLAPLIAGILGVLAPIESITFWHITTAIYVGLTLAFAQACGQCINQYADAKLDGLIKKYRPIPSGLISREEALGTGWIFALFAIGRAFTISGFLGIITIILIFFAVFYSLAPFSPRKIHPLLNVGWMGISRGFIPVCAVLSINGDLNIAGQYGILAFVWVMSFQATKDVVDSEGDRRMGIRTIINTYNANGLTTLMIAGSCFYAFFCIFFELYVMMLLLVVAAITILLRNKTLSFAENNVGWLGFYSGLAVFYILLFVSF